MLAAVQFERGELSAVPAEDVRQGPQRLRDLVHVASRVLWTPRALPEHRRSLRHRSAANHAFRPNHLAPDLCGMIIRSEFAPSPSGGRLANPLSQAPILD